MSLVIETMQPETVADEATRKWGMGREESGERRSGVREGARNILKY